MSEEEKPGTAELLTMIKQMTQQPTAAASGWKKQEEETPAGDIQAVMVPISVYTGEGKIRIYLQVSGAAAKDQDSLIAMIDKLSGMGLPLEFWKDYKKKKGGWNK